MLFDGFLALYQEGRDDEDDEEDGRLPQVKQGERRPRSATSRPTSISPNRRRAISEASLVKKLEELGIGRPSTYASILTMLRDRDYVRMDKNRFMPEDKGRLVTAFLENFFRRYVEYDFTADLEEKLDLVSAGDLDGRSCCASSGRLQRRHRRHRRAAHHPGARRAERSPGPHIFPPREDGSAPGGRVGNC